MRKLIVLGAAIALGVTTVAAVQYNQSRVAEEQEGLLARATVKPEQAEAIALAKFPGKIIESEIEEENGVLLYSFEIETADGIRDVEIDAHTGVLTIDDEEDDDDKDDDDKDDDGRRR